ncbi:unnamed protein product [Schistosoma mattheei]|uniref:Uncharacterized protein n=1 Tax=Schistosoma mattheei TaxID=31246 RepID=A0A183NF92_9TREM|nr:unnamed protein product [Schistosoma mattheei]
MHSSILKEQMTYEPIVLGRLNDALKQITHTLNIYYDHHESNYNELTNEKYNKLLADAYDCRGIIYLQLGRFQYAIDDLTNSIRLNRYSTKYLIDRGVAYFCNHQLMPAMIDFKINIDQLIGMQWLPVRDAVNSCDVQP